MALPRFFETGDLKEYDQTQEVRGRMYPGDDSPQVQEQRVLIRVDVAYHSGVESLGMLLPGGLDQTRDRLAEIKEQLGAISAPDVMKPREEDSPLTGIGIAMDCNEGMETKTMTVEQLAADTADEDAEGEEVGG